MTTTHYVRIQGPLVVDEPVALHCVVATHVEVTEHGELLLYGVVGGDVRVRPGGRAVIHGRVDGTVFNEGEVEVLGKVANLRSTDGATTTISETANVRYAGRIRYESAVSG